jgi:Raf kinase inhibitor-like YbhB/YbcL family protein
MQIQSSTFKNNGRIPEHCAFGVPDKTEHMQLGKNRNPHLRWTDIPAATRSFVLLCVDSDVPSIADSVNQEGLIISADLPRVDFYHWVLMNIPAAISEIAEGACSEGVVIGGKKYPEGPEGSRQGLNDYTSFLAGNPDMEGNYCGYDGPCPPWNDAIMHHYHFVLYATDLKSCPANKLFTGQEVLAAIDGHVLAEARLTGTYSLNPTLS